jgi:hypothetical protein
MLRFKHLHIQNFKIGSSEISSRVVSYIVTDVLKEPVTLICKVENGGRRFLLNSNEHIYVPNYPISHLKDHNLNFYSCEKLKYHIQNPQIINNSYFHDAI